MKLDTDFAGMCFRDFHTEITWRRTMNYAAAVGDPNPFYFDDERERGVIAPPMFAVAVTWPISERIWDYIDADNFPKEILATQVHFTEHLLFHRPVRPGDKLTIKGSIAEISPHKAGTLVVIRYRAVDEQGRSVFTEYLGGLMRGVECCGEAKNSEPLPTVPEHKGQGPPLWETPIFIDPVAPFVYDGCTNIFFPIHTSVAFARGLGLPGIILQGTATLAYAIREIINREADGNPYALRSVACRFTGMVVPGSEIRMILSGRSSDGPGTDLFFKVLNAAGSPAISGAYARLERSNV
ncbi:MAG: MaoC family dehydratase N-terminal domain-containing protein [Desulfomonile tiedjei]|nr:MaoC family dehydratase N-terminal domain-containing protein [Desulfomonile tiedjei]